MNGNPLLQEYDEVQKVDDTGGKAQYAVKFFMGLGWSAEQSNGIVANLMHESGGGLNTQAVGDGGKSIGIAQWNNERRAALMQRENPYSLDTQLQFVHDELTGSEKGAGDALRLCSTKEEAVKVFSQKYERPGKPMMNSRMTWSNRIWAGVKDAAYDASRWAGNNLAGPAQSAEVPLAQAAEALTPQNPLMAEYETFQKGNRFRQKVQRPGWYVDDGPQGVIPAAFNYLGVTPDKADPIQLEAATTGRSLMDIRNESFGTGYTEEARAVAGGFLNSMTFGASGTMEEVLYGERHRAESAAGAALEGVASMAGTLAGPLGVSGKIVSGGWLGTKLLPTSTGLSYIGQMVAHSSASLGLAHTMSAVLPALMKHDELSKAAIDIAESGKAGAISGALYGGFNLVNNKALRGIIGIAVMDLYRAKTQGGVGNFTLDDFVEDIISGKANSKEISQKVSELLMDAYFITKAPSMKAGMKALAERNALGEMVYGMNPKELREAILAGAGTEPMPEIPEGKKWVGKTQKFEPVEEAAPGVQAPSILEQNMMPDITSEEAARWMEANPGRPLWEAVPEIRAAKEAAQQLRPRRERDPQPLPEGVEAATPLQTAMLAEFLRKEYGPTYSGLVRADVPPESVETFRHISQMVKQFSESIGAPAYLHIVETTPRLGGLHWSDPGGEHHVVISSNITPERARQIAVHEIFHGRDKTGDPVAQDLINGINTGHSHFIEYDTLLRKRYAETNQRVLTIRDMYGEYVADIMARVDELGPVEGKALLKQVMVEGMDVEKTYNDYFGIKTGRSKREMDWGFNEAEIREANEAFVKHQEEMFELEKEEAGFEAMPESQKSPASALREAYDFLTGKTTAEQLKRAGSILVEDTTNAVREAPEAARRANETLSELGQKIKAWWKNPYEIKERDFVNIIKRWSAEEQIHGLQNEQFLQKLQVAVPKEIDRMGITGWIQANGDDAVLTHWAANSTGKLKKGYEAALRLDPVQKAMALEVSAKFKDLLSWAKSEGMLLDSIENYVTQLWKGRRASKYELQKLQNEANAGILDTNFNYAQEKIFGSYFEGEQAGKVPRNKDIGYIMGTYYRAVSDAVLARQAIRELVTGTADDGMPMVTPGGARVATDQEIRPREFVHAQPIEVADRTLDGRLYKPHTHPALRGWKWIETNKDGTETVYQGDMYVHPDVFARLDNILGVSKIQEFAVGRGILKLQANLKGVLLSAIPTPFHQVHVGTHAMFHLINPFNAGPIDLNNPMHLHAIRSGVLVYSQKGIEQFAEGMAAVGLAQKIPLIGRWNRAYSDYLFKDLIPRYKMALFEAAYKRNMERYGPESVKKTYPEALVAEITANQVNAAFGELNLKVLGRDKTLQDAFRLLSLAPDFLEARVRFVGQAIRPGGHEQFMALFRATLFIYGGAAIANMLFSDDQKPHLLDAPGALVIGGKQWSLRSVPGDALHAILDRQGFIYNRLNPVTARAPFEMLGGRDQWGHQIDAKDMVVNLLRSVTPIPVQGFISKGEQTVFQGVAKMLGVGSKTYRDKSQRTIDDFFASNHRDLTPEIRREHDHRKVIDKMVDAQIDAPSPDKEAKIREFLGQQSPKMLQRYLKRIQMLVQFHGLENRKYLMQLKAVNDVEIRAKAFVERYNVLMPDAQKKLVQEMYMVKGIATKRFAQELKLIQQGGRK